MVAPESPIHCIGYTEIVGAHWHQGQNVVSFLNTDMNDEILQSF